MPPQVFLDTFMNPGHELPPCPEGDFSRVAQSAEDVQDMCTPFVRIMFSVCFLDIPLSIILYRIDTLCEKGQPVSGTQALYIPCEEEMV